MILRAESITKTFQQGPQTIRVLSDLSFTVAEGETVALLGQSGSGKSTLLSIIAGLDRPDSGEMFVVGQALSQMNESELTDFRARHLSLVFQQFHLLGHMTALENVALPLQIIGEAEAEQRALALLSDVGLRDRAMHFPSQLSGGECQRVAIARALITRPKLLLADEPTGNLDLRTGEAVMQIFFDLVKKHSMTTLIVTHNEELAARCSRQLYLRSGRLDQAA